MTDNDDINDFPVLSGLVHFKTDVIDFSGRQVAETFFPRLKMQCIAMQCNAMQCILCGFGSKPHLFSYIVFM
jgi:hypothetical protein